MNKWGLSGVLFLKLLIMAYAIYKIIAKKAIRFGYLFLICILKYFRMDGP